MCVFSVFVNYVCVCVCYINATNFLINMVPSHPGLPSNDGHNLNTFVVAMFHRQ